jgi:hypothetical protein
VTRDQLKGKTFHSLTVLSACIALVIPGALRGATVPVPQAPSLPVTGYPYGSENFHQAAPRGFGDFNNSWAQAMIWWNGNLYVGTARDSTCTSDYAIWQYIELNVSLSFANTYYPYPPTDPDLTCAPGPLLPLQAEIWRSPGSGSWTRVYQSPAVIPNPGPGYGQPAPVGAPLLPYEIAIRDFAQVTEPNGTNALYAFTVNSGIMWDQTKIPPPRILRTTDGVNWAPLPQDAGTFLATLPFSSDHTSFRVGVTYNGQLFAICGPVEGEGTVIASANPAAGDNTWFVATPPGMQFYDMAVFNGWLYLGGYDSTGTMYQVFKTNAQGPPPYQLITIVPQGGYLTNPFPSASVVSMLVHDNRLYVGTATFTEVIRINTDDTWDLVVGIPRQVPTSSGGLAWKYPLSNLGAGFGLTLNDHAWQMDDDNGYLYIGTYNASTASRLAPNGSVLFPYMGAHLYSTASDWYFNPVTTNGFGSTSAISSTGYLNQLDPHGGIFDYGFRTMANTPAGFFVGTANDYFGLAVFEAPGQPSPPLNPPSFLEVEPAISGGALLSWQATPSATSYQVYRAELLPIAIRQNPSFENSTGGTGIDYPDVYVTPYSLVGTTANLTYLDSTALSGQNYLYYIVATNSANSSDPSNLTTFPGLLPPITFAQLVSDIDVLGQRQRFTSPKGEIVLLGQISTAQTFAAQCQISSAINSLAPSYANGLVESPDLTDVGILMYQLGRRLQLYAEYPTQVMTTEFCTTATTIH